MTEEARCYIDNSKKHVDDHHLDCLRGKLSPETVPLCRRCHRTYHDFGVKSFSPDTTLKAIEIENRRREIWNNSDHGWHLEPLTLIEVMSHRSSYWYKKHGAHRWNMFAARAPRAFLQRQKLGFKIPNRPVLCGEDWLREHFSDHTPEEISALFIEVSYSGKKLPPVLVADKKGTIKKLVRSCGGR